MISKQQFVNLAWNISNELLQVDVGGEEEANAAMKKLYKNNVVQLAFIASTGKAKEFESWLERFHKSHPGLAKSIEQNLELTEETQTIEE